jgi:hypothetical protein
MLSCDSRRPSAEARGPLARRESHLRRVVRTSSRAAVRGGASGVPLARPLIIAAHHAVGELLELGA